jgi:multidrug efflux pump subunit AcrA (membrane-fusion protein)
MTAQNGVATRSRLVSIALVAALAVFALVFHRQLVAWFSGESMADYAGPSVTVHASGLSLSASLDPDPPRTQGNALVVQVRDGVGKPVDDATVEVSYDMPAMGAMAEMKGGAHVDHEKDGRYRAHFDLPMNGTWTLKVDVHAPAGAVSQRFSLMVGTAGLSPMGGAMSVADPMGSPPSAAALPGEVDHYTCSMHPSVKQAGPGKCPICGMDLIPVTKEQQQEGVVMIDDMRRQLIGVRTEPVVLAPMRKDFRVVGHVTYDESSLADVNLKVHGWITKLYVSQTGQKVTRGQPLLSLYSPELYNAEQDFILATQGAAAPSVSLVGGPNRGEMLARAARQRLHLLGLEDVQIDALAKQGMPSESVPIAAPASGFVIEKNVVEGASVDAGMRLYRIAALTKVWIEAQVYEGDLAGVRAGQAASVTLDYLPGRMYDAKVAYVYPYLDPQTRTAQVRLELANKDLDLRPGMYASVTLGADLGPRVQVPSAAVVYTGPRRLVFVDLGQGRFRPEEVSVGAESNGMYEVLSGLQPGDQVATSGVFLIAAEARISTASKYWDSPELPIDGGAPMHEPTSMPGPALMPTMQSAPGHAGAPMAMRHPAPMNTPVGLGLPASGASASSGAEPPASPATVYSCPMHPDVTSPTPGKCPKCGMELQPMPKRGMP